ncbi:hypothetical protein MM26B8_02840 [Mycoplasmopsis meleagridis]|uniref:Cupin 2 conserved barrel domain-containing protein n=1 Tax=Mycoplasmopsis meleagridis ATCC 25294 TaxID=1264554 RepID=A0A0F5H1I0_9BACT|nr:hypothetical protein [Mycoplasmopsis meleagridis]KKB27010.1 hypothetical protein MMELEA_03230 [Mycoplasmopsis meleagridis ATCC 25294]OAD18357.1 hypothetical protein MM26B8_02840 [Mycoplasmopsis meleagridis]VEU77487.1 Uncharacterised protein [Mycoplasmopsis meleagridis]
MDKQISFLSTYNFTKFNFSNLKKGKEKFDLIYDSKNFYIQIIYSKKVNSSWMKNDTIENVFLLKGKAILEDENKNIIKMKKGDFLTIKEELKHKINWSSRKCIWIALHHK